jgi:beta-1,4-mannosyl-glycoprotein beta-1,4-N-acetylglucosaminyltransferase
MKIYDCFLFNNELDMLELKLTEMSDGVDYFIIGEADRTFKGDPKPMYLRENWARFEPWHHKIRLIDITTPADPDPWVNETQDREQLMRGLYDADPYDVIICSDCDELFRSTALNAIRTTPMTVNHFSLRVAQFVFKLNYMMTRFKTDDGVEMFFHIPCLATRFKFLQGIERQKKLRNETELPQTARIWHAGWHFTFMGNSAWVKEKLKLFDYTWLGEFVDQDLDVEQRIAERRFLGEKDATIFEICQVNDYMPRTIREYPDRWKSWVLPADSAPDARAILNHRLATKKIQNETVLEDQS